MSPDVAERLVKPTAASLQKTRGAGQASARSATPVKRGAAPTRGTASVRGTKARGGAAGVKTKVAAAGAGAGVAAATAVVAADVASPVETPEQPTTPTTEESEQVVLHDEPEEHVEEAAHVPEAETHAEAETEPAAAAEPEEALSNETVDLATPSHAADEATSEPEDVLAAAATEEPEQSGSTSPVPQTHHDNEHDDLADLVSMLEAKKPVVGAGADEPTGEIPDDE
jgi:hypothetical protein